jgi:hypothetical protein
MEKNKYKFYKVLMGFTLKTDFYTKHLIAGDLITNAEYTYLTQLQTCMVHSYGTALADTEGPTNNTKIENLPIMSKRKRGKTKKDVQKINVLKGLTSIYTKKESIEQALNALFTKTGKQIENPNLEYTPKEGSQIVIYDDFEDDYQLRRHFGYY